MSAFFSTEELLLTASNFASCRETSSIKTAHYQLVRDIDINGNQPYYFVSGGDDCKVKFWDSRNTSQPLKTLAQHSHWVAQVKYNQYRDALLITSSTDWMVNLWNIPSLAFRDPTKGKSKSKQDTPQEGSLAHSQQLLLRSQSTSIRDGGKKDLHQDHLIRGYQDHEDSVYSICWSWADGENPWLFASASYDGRVIINKVPQHEIEAVTTDLENIEV
ncbi:MAG: WD40 repeat domain-containing protein [Oligoflexus sp.]